MRRFCSLLFLTGILCATWAHAEAVTPADARARAVDAEQVLVGLNYYLVEDYFHQGDFDTTVAIFERIIALNPIGTEPYATAAWLLWSSKKTDAALAMYDRMIAANPLDPEGYFEYGAFYVRVKNDAEAVKWLEKAVNLGLPSPQRHLYGLALTRLGRNDDVLAFWRMVIAEDPHDAIAQREIDKLTGKETPPAAAPAAPDAKQ